MTEQYDIARAGAGTVGGQFSSRAALHPDRIALDDGQRQRSYGELNDRVNRTAAVLSGHGIGRGDRVALLSENCIEFIELMLAAAKIGAILACQNWRLSSVELSHCIQLVSPRLIICSERYQGLLQEIEGLTMPVRRLGSDWEAALAQAAADEPAVDVNPEDGLLILYTSGTTGLPKGAVISHRAEVARAMLQAAEGLVSGSDTFVAWPPLFHMGGTDATLATLMMGGKVLVVDGFDVDRLCDLLATEPVGWFILMPGMIEPINDQLRRRDIRPDVRCCGAMADLVPAHVLAETTELFGAPYLNTFGSTETGMPPCSSGRIMPGLLPNSLSKTQTPFCELRLVDADDRDVPDGMPGEAALRGPTLFSGYWRADETNARDFRGGWFHLGDMFVRNPDGTLDFVDRVKYMIKSGGENIYPAELERVLLADARVADACIVRQTDDKWGEVPVAFVARNSPDLTAEDLVQLCRKNLARYKQPKGILFIDIDDFPRSTTGKIQRHELELRLKGEASSPAPADGNMD